MSSYLCQLHVNRRSHTPSPKIDESIITVEINGHSKLWLYIRSCMCVSVSQQVKG